MVETGRNLFLCTRMVLVMGQSVQWNIRDGNLEVLYKYLGTKYLPILDNCVLVPNVTTGPTLSIHQYVILVIPQDSP